MNRKHIVIAAFLRNTAESASAHADELDPTRRKPTDVTVALDRVALTCSDAFHTLTGKFPSGVKCYELNTEHPADWVKSLPYSGVDWNSSR